MSKLFSVIFNSEHLLSYASSHNPYIVWIGGVLWTLYTLSRWKNYKGLIKRCVLALPFALLAAITMKVLGFEILLSCMAGVLLFNCLLVETNNLKRHFIITLIGVTASILAVVLVSRFVDSHGDNSSKGITIAVIYLAMGCGFAVLVFYQSYCAKLGQTQKSQKLAPLAVKSIKLAATIFAAVALLAVSNILCYRYQISFAISFGISVLIALGLWGFCTLFNIKNPAFSDVAERRAKKMQQTNMCECCGKTGLTQEFLFKIDSGQQVCAGCLKRMEQGK
jgi:hypothetical protein